MNIFSCFAYPPVCSWLLVTHITCSQNVTTCNLLSVWMMPVMSPPISRSLKDLSCGVISVERGEQISLGGSRQCCVLDGIFLSMTCCFLSIGNTPVVHWWMCCRFVHSDAGKLWQCIFGLVIQDSIPICVSLLLAKLPEFSCYCVTAEGFSWHTQVNTFLRFTSMGRTGSHSELDLLTKSNQFILESRQIFMLNLNKFLYSFKLLSYISFPCY